MIPKFDVVVEDLLLFNVSEITNIYYDLTFIQQREVGPLESVAGSVVDVITRGQDDLRSTSNQRLYARQNPIPAIN